MQDNENLKNALFRPTWYNFLLLIEDHASRVKCNGVFFFIEAIANEIVQRGRERIFYLQNINLSRKPLVYLQIYKHFFYLANAIKTFKIEIN